MGDSPQFRISPPEGFSPLTMKRSVYCFKDDEGICIF